VDSQQNQAVIDTRDPQQVDSTEQFYHRSRCIELAIQLHLDRAMRPAYKDLKPAALAEEMVSNIVSSAFVFHQFAIGALDEEALLGEDD